MIYDPSNPKILANPYPYFSYLRRTDPVHWNNSLKSWVLRDMMMLEKYFLKTLLQ